MFFITWIAVVFKFIYFIRIILRQLCFAFIALLLLISLIAVWTAIAFHGCSQICSVFRINLFFNIKFLHLFIFISFTTESTKISVKAERTIKCFVDLICTVFFFTHLANLGWMTHKTTIHFFLLLLLLWKLDLNFCSWSTFYRIVLISTIFAVFFLKAIFTVFIRIIGFVNYRFLRNLRKINSTSPTVVLIVTGFAKNSFFLIFNKIIIDFRLTIYAFFNINSLKIYIFFLTYLTGVSA